MTPMTPDPGDCLSQAVAAATVELPDHSLPLTVDVYTVTSPTVTVASVWWGHHHDPGWTTHITAHGVWTGHGPPAKMTLDLDEVADTPLSWLTTLVPALRLTADGTGTPVSPHRWLSDTRAATEAGARLTSTRMNLNHSIYAPLAPGAAPVRSPGHGVRPDLFVHPDTLVVLYVWDNTGPAGGWRVCAVSSEGPETPAHDQRPAAGARRATAEPPDGAQEWALRHLPHHVHLVADP